MSRYKRWFPVDQDINHNPKMRELMREFGLSGFRIWLEILSIGDRGEGTLDCTSVGAQLRLTSASESKQQVTTKVVGWLHNRGCLLVVDEQNHLSRIAKYTEYHRTRTPSLRTNGNQLAALRTEPNLTIPKEKEREEKESVFLTRTKKKIGGEDLKMFEQFWATFNYKQGKAEAGDAWLQIVWGTDRQAQFQQILQGARAEAQRRPSLLQAGKTPKMAQGWLSGRRWEDTNTLQSSSLSSTCSQCVEKDPGARFFHWLSFGDEDQLKQHFYSAFGFDDGQKKFTDNVAWWRTKQSIRKVQDNGRAGESSIDQSHLERIG